MAINQPIENIQGSQLSFLDLINEYRITIPVIQRDYAQGRTTKSITELRENFANDLIKYLQDNQTHMLDFIYGTIQTHKVNTMRDDNTDQEFNEFIPLDGQQRLTTLFLLHIYIAGMVGGQAFEALQTILKKNPFTYQTRESSRLFCKELVAHNVFTKFNSTANKKLSQVICNQGWFFLSWKQDPTVAGMLEMLDAIHVAFSNSIYSVNEAYERLFNIQPQPIMFQWLSLPNYTRTDDLYIKMNARGVKLTDFEIFKSKYEQFLDTLVAVNNLDKDKTTDFKNKIDAAWTDFFWKRYQNNGSIDNILQNLMQLFIAYSYKKSLNNKEQDELIERLYGLNKKHFDFKFYQYNDAKVLHNDSVNIDQIVSDINDYFEILCDENISPLTDNNIPTKFNVKDALENRIFKYQYGLESEKQVTYSIRIRLFAYLKYMQKHKHQQNIDKQDLDDWMRIIRNLENDRNVDAAIDLYNFLNAIEKLLNKISEDKQGIIEWLAAVDKNFDGFSSHQFKEERLKALLIQWGRDKDASAGGLSKIEGIINDYENHDYLKGQMGFVLNLAGAYEKFGQLKDMPQREFNQLQQEIEKYAEAAKAVFTALNNNQNDNEVYKWNLLERALLVYGNYLKEATQNRWNFCNRPGDRDWSWRALLKLNGTDDNNEDSTTNSETLKCLENVLNNVVDINDVAGLLKKIIQNGLKGNLPSWRQLLIKTDAAIDYCHEGFIHRDDIDKDNPTILLYSKSQRNARHVDLWIYDLYKSCSETLNMQLGEVYGTTDDSYAYILYDNSGYELRFYHRNNLWSCEIWQRSEENVKKLDGESTCQINNHPLNNECSIKPEIIAWFHEVIKKQDKDIEKTLPQ